MSSNAITAAGFVRAADAMLRALGASAVTLRIPVTGGPADGLGLAPPLVEEIALAPAAVRRSAGGKLEVLLSASAVQAVVDERGLTSAAELFSLALRLLHAGRELRILAAQADSHAGIAYLYRVAVEEGIS